MAVALTACSDGGSEAAPSSDTTAPATTSAPEPPASTTTALAPATTVTSRPPATASTPEVAAKALYDAWTKGDRTAAARVAQPAAITTLFGRTWQTTDRWSFSECSGAAGSLVCTWLRPGGQQLMMRVQNSPASVAEVRFQA